MILSHHQCFPLSLSSPSYETNKNTLTDTDNNTVIIRGKGWGEVGEGKGGVIGDGGRLGWGGVILTRHTIGVADYQSILPPKPTQLYRPTSPQYIR